MSCHVASTNHYTPTSISQTIPLCLMCNASHHKLYHCNSFRRLSPQQRLNFVTNTNLSFICFSSQHGACNCIEKPTYQTAGCRYKHSKLLHFDRPKAETEVKGVDYRPVRNSYNRIGNNVLLPLVPVMVNFEIDT